MRQSGLLILSGLILAAIGMGCATSKTVSRPILDEAYNKVRLEAWLDDSGKPVPLGFEHPVEISETDLSRILQSIQIVDPPGMLSRLILKAKATPEPAFTKKEADFLANPLASALKSAKPNERVVFFLNHRRSAYKGTTSSGVVFIKDNRLNVILGWHRRGNQPGKPDIVIGGKPFPSSNDQPFYAIAGNFQSIVEERTAPGGQETVFPKRWVSIDYPALLESPPQTAGPVPGTSAAAPEGGEETAAAPDLTLEEKLRTLHRLQEEGLITEEEYTEKKKALLESF